MVVLRDFVVGWLFLLVVGKRADDWLNVGFALLRNVKHFIVAEGNEDFGVCNASDIPYDRVIDKLFNKLFFQVPSEVFDFVVVISEEQLRVENMFWLLEVVAGDFLLYGLLLE